LNRTRLRSCTDTLFHFTIIAMPSPFQPSSSGAVSKLATLPRYVGLASLVSEFQSLTAIFGLGFACHCAVNRVVLHQPSLWYQRPHHLTQTGSERAVLPVSFCAWPRNIRSVGRPDRNPQARMVVCWNADPSTSDLGVCAYILGSRGPC
jgi:hypothetical protein